MHITLQIFIFLYFINYSYGGILNEPIPVFPAPLPLRYPDDYCDHIKDNEVFDYVVIGGGTAGAVVARRLAEVNCWRVLLLEAGGNPPPLYDVPGFMAVPLPLTEKAAQWPTTNLPTPNVCTGMVRGHCNFRQVKALGGCSQLNFFLYVRGNKKDYDKWSENGNPGWSFDEVLPFFKKTEHYLANPITPNGSDLTVSERYHSRDGELTINSFDEDPATIEIRYSLTETMEKMGVKKVLDINNEDQIGLVDCQATVGTNRYRTSTARAFLLNPPPNMKICKYALVDRVIVKGRRAVAVEFTHAGNRRLRVFTAKEIIISAGAFNSPGILERSGIGDPKLLKKHGIPVKNHLSGVGENLNDHFILTGDGWSVDLIKRGPINLQTTALTSLTAFVDSIRGDGVPDVQYLFFAMPKLKPWMTPPFVTLLNYEKRIGRQFSEVTKKRDLLMIAPALLHPQTSGSIHISSKDHEIPPDMDLTIFTNEADLRTLIDAARYSAILMNSTHMQRHKPKKIVIKKCYQETGSSDSDEYYKCLLRTTASTLYHPTGTCKMGPKADPLAVVDHNLLVHGTVNLRVIDASVMPQIISGNTNAPTIMIGEKGADIIKKKWLLIGDYCSPMSLSGGFGFGTPISNGLLDKYESAIAPVIEHASDPSSLAILKPNKHNLLMNIGGFFMTLPRLLFGSSAH